MNVSELKTKLKLLKYELQRIFARPYYTLPYSISYFRYIKSQLLKSSIKGNHEPDYDLVFVVFGFAKNWILEAICREIAAYFPGKYCFHYSETNLPPSKAYFIAHYSFLPACVKLNPHIWGSKIIVWYTHPRNDLGISNDELIYILNKTTKVISACSQFARLLISQGLKSDQVTYIWVLLILKYFSPMNVKMVQLVFVQLFIIVKNQNEFLILLKRCPIVNLSSLVKGGRNTKNF